MSFPYDSLEARRQYRTFKSTLTRRTRLHRHAAIVALWEEFRAYYHTRNWPLPDDWRLWSNASDDARRALALTRITSTRDTLATPCMVCGKALALHFDRRNRKLDCARAPSLPIALADARSELATLTRYVARLEALA